MTAGLIYEVNYYRKTTETLPIILHYGFYATRELAERAIKELQSPSYTYFIEARILWN